MNELEKYERVNSCETIEELQQCILNFAINGIIQGRTREFDANKMAENALHYYNDDSGDLWPNVMTREYGIRQQAMYLKYYK